MVCQDVHHVPVVRPRPQGPRGGHGPVAVTDLAAGEGRRGRREPSGGGRLYGNMHHNSLGQRHLTDCTVRPGSGGARLLVSFSSEEECVSSLGLFLPSFLPPDVARLESPTTACARRMEARIARNPQSQPSPPVLGTRRVDLLLCHPPGCLARSANLPNVACKVSHTSERALNGRVAFSRPSVLLQLSLTQRIPPSNKPSFLRESAKICGQ